MIGSVRSSRSPSHVDTTLPSPPSARVPDAVKIRDFTGRRPPVAPGEDIVVGSPGAAAKRRAGSLNDQVVQAIRPEPKIQNHFRPVRLRKSLARLQLAIERLDIVDQDPLMKTAHSILAEEGLRAGLLSQRLQMILEG